MSKYLNTNLFNAIAQQSKYDQKVAMKEREMEYASRMEQRAERRLNAQLMAQETVNQSLEQLNEKLQTMHPNDLARVRNLEKQARQSIYQGIRNANGDVNQFLLEGGFNTIREYKQNVLQSDEVARGLRNKEQFNLIQEALSDNKLVHDMPVTLTTKDGKQVQKMVSTKEAIQLFNDNMIQDISFTGAEERVEVNLEDFQKIVNPNNPFSSAPVSQEAFYNYLVSKGQGRDVARQRLSEFETDQYGNVKGAFYGMKNGTNYRSNGARWNNYKTTKGGTYSKNLPYLNVFNEFNNLTLARPMEQTDWIYDEGHGRMTIEERTTNPAFQDAISSFFGLQKSNVEGSPYVGSFQNAVSIQNLSNGKELGLTADEYQLVGLENIVVATDQETGETQYFQQAKIRISEETMEDKFDEPWWGGTSKLWGAVTQDVEDELGEGRIITVGVSLPSDAVSRQLISEEAAVEQGTVVGGAYQQNYMGSYVQADPNSMQRPEDMIMGNNQQMAMQQSSNNLLFLEQQNLFNQMKQQTNASDQEIYKAIQEIYRNK
jgi:hypothetical protein